MQGFQAIKVLDDWMLHLVPAQRIVLNSVSHSGAVARHRSLAVTPDALLQNTQSDHCNLGPLERLFTS